MTPGMTLGTTLLASLAEHLLEVTAVFTVGLAAVLLLRRRSAALRHAVLAASLLVVPLIPVTGLVSPAWQVPALDRWFTSDAAGTSTLRWMQEPAPLLPAAPSTPSANAAPAAGPVLTPLMLLAGAWLAGVAAGLLQLCVGMRRLSALAAETLPLTAPAWTTAAAELAQRFGIARRVDLRQSHHPTLLVTWGLWRPRVVVPATATDWPADRIRSVLAHELAHVRRSDWAVQLAAEVVRIAYWFHPLAWVACRRLRDESEHACDDTVIDSGVAAQDYATHLFEVARTFAVHPRRWIPAAAIARPSTLERRIAAMLNANPHRRPARRWAPAAAVVMMGSVAVISAGFQPGAAPIVGLSADVPLTATELTATRFAATPPVATLPAGTPPVAQPAAAPRQPAPAPSALPPAVAAAQAPTQASGQTILFGRIFDPSGAVLPGVEVFLTGSGITDGRRAVSDGSGFYQFEGVAAGDYTVAMSLPGFRTGRAAVVVPSSGTVEFSTNMQIGSLEETITVTGQRTNPFAPSRQRQATAAPPPQQPPLQRRAPSPRVNTPPGPVRVGGMIKAPRKLLDVRPIYPPAAQAAGLDGVVILEATIGTDGTVTDARILRALEPDLNDAAMNAVRGWKFSPTLLNGVEVPVIMTVTVQFVLQ
jgi:TonB family protein